MSSPTVFISYSHKDKKWVRNWLLPRLEENGIKVIIDYRDFKLGLASIINIEQAVDRADKTLLVLTPNWVKSEWTNFEAILVQSDDLLGLRQRTIPLMLKDCTPLKRVSFRTYADFRNEDNWQTEITRLISQITQKPTTGAEPAIKIAFPDKVSLARLPKTSSLLLGREKELEILDTAWENSKTNVVSMVAWGGVGKTALVKEWLNRLRDGDWRGANRVLGWSFYSQGTREDRQVSADEFFESALRWFGDPEPTEGSFWEKAERLADFIKSYRTLLILDGLEPLQDPSPERLGCIKDRGLEYLIKELANQNQGLCVLTTRLTVGDIDDLEGKTVERIDLSRLPDEAGSELLRKLGVENATDDELLDVVHELAGHALALTLLGRYVAVKYKGDIRQRDKIPALAKEKKQGEHARQIMELYAKWYENKPELELLYIMGLFDRPAPDAAIKALRAKPIIEGLTSRIQKLSDADWQDILDNLREVSLIAPEDQNDPDTLDCHPLVREHFGEKLQKNNPEAWKEAHSRLYEYYKSVPEKEQPDTIEEMAPLYAAVGHGCQAGRYQEALNEVYWPRISRKNKFYSTSQLGAFGADLAALSGFFDVRWHEPAKTLTDHDQAFVLNSAGYRLRALGRLSEAIQPFVAALEGSGLLERWENASTAAGNVSELKLTLGNLAQAFTHARESVEHADRSGVDSQRMLSRTTVADTLHQLGRMAEAETVFKEAEEKQKVWQPEYPLLYSVQGFRYCDLLLSLGNYENVLSRTVQTIKIAEAEGWLLDIALDNLSLGRSQLMKAQTEKRNDFPKADNYLNKAVDGLRQAAQQDDIPRGLLARAELYRVQRDFHKADHDVNEAITITIRDGMRLHEADCHLEYARLYLAMGDKAKAGERLGTAAKMIEEMEYHRRDPEVHLAYAQLYIAEGKKDKARKHLAAAQKMIDDMGLHRWDKDAADLAKALA